MRTLKWVAVVPALTACALAPAARARSPDFAAMEDQLSDALARYDARAMDALWDDRFVFVFPTGHLSHKAERLAGLTPPATRSGANLTSHNDGVEVQYQDDHMAIVTVASTWRAGPRDAGDRYLATHVWVRRGARWRLLSAQVAHLEP